MQPVFYLTIEITNGNKKMTITLNHRTEQIDAESISLSQLLKEKNFSFRMLVVKLNGHLIPKENRDQTIVRDGDEVQVIHLMSGG